jgi:hypothetical protein
MARHLRLEFEGAIYHIAAWGNERSDVSAGGGAPAQGGDGAVAAEDRTGCGLGGRVRVGSSSDASGSADEEKLEIASHGGAIEETRVSLFTIKGLTTFPSAVFPNVAENA